MLKILAVGAGGFIGAVMRFLVGGWVQRSFGQAGFPLGTISVNLAGCLIIGLLGGITESREIFSPNVRLLVFIGILGSFTTFSTFGFETMALLRDGEFLLGALNVTLHILLGLIAVWAGYTLAHTVFH